MDNNKLTHPVYLKSRELWKQFQAGRITAAELEERLAGLGDKVKETQPEIQLVKDYFSADVLEEAGDE